MSSDARWVSPCCNSTHHIEGQGGPAGNSFYRVCDACGQPCDPMDAALRERIVREGMERAAKVCDCISDSHRKGDHIADYSLTAPVADECAAAIRAAMEEGK